MRLWMRYEGDPLTMKAKKESFLGGSHVFTKKCFYFQVFYTEILWQQEVDSFSRRYVHVHDEKT